MLEKIFKYSHVKLLIVDFNLNDNPISTCNSVLRSVNIFGFLKCWPADTYCQLKNDRGLTSLSGYFDK